MLTRIGLLSVGTYGVLVTAGLFLPLPLAAQEGKQAGISSEGITGMGGGVVLLSAVVGSKGAAVILARNVRSRAAGRRNPVCWRGGSEKQ